jgi:hypothetical protein
MRDEQKFNLHARLVTEIIDSVSEGQLPLAGAGTLLDCVSVVIKFFNFLRLLVVSIIFFSHSNLFACFRDRNEKSHFPFSSIAFL